jgi:hypothetical protein
VLSFSPVVGIGTPPPPHPQASVPPPFGSVGRGTLACGRGGGGLGWGFLIPSDEGTYTVVLFIYMYFVPNLRAGECLSAPSDSCLRTAPLLDRRCGIALASAKIK